MGCFEDDPPPPPAAPVAYPQPQSLSSMAGDAAAAQTQAFKDLIPLLPQYAQTMTDIQRTQAPQLGEIALKEQQTTAPNLIRAALENLKIADPTGLAVRESLGQNALQGLSADRFGKLSPEEIRQAEQNVRAGQVARGGGTGLSDSIEEALSKYNLGNQRQQQQLSNAGSFLAGQPPQSQFGNVQAPVGTQNVQGISSSLFPSTNALIGAQAQQFGQLSQNAAQQNNYGLGVAQYNQQYSSNPFMTGLGVALDVGSKLGGAALMCWVAEACYGKDNPKTHRIRAFVRHHLSDKSDLGDFCREYLEKGVQWAERIKRNMKDRLDAIDAWDKLDEMALKEGF